MNRIYFIILFCVTLCIAGTHGFSADHKPAPRDEETERAFELERSADLVIDYERSSAISLYVSGKKKSTTTDIALASAIASANPKRTLVVVIIGKPMRHQYPEPQLSTKVDEIEAIVKAQGFSRIVFQLAAAFGRPIYRDVVCISKEKKEANQQPEPTRMDDCSAI